MMWEVSLVLFLLLVIVPILALRAAPASASCLGPGAPTTTPTKAHNTFKRRLGGFVGVVLNADGAANNNFSRPDGVVAHNRWLYAGDGNGTLKVFDLNGSSSFVQSIPTGGTTRVAEMALTDDGTLLIAANNAENPPFATLFRANGDARTSHVSIITKILINPAIVPAGASLSIEQPTWEPRTGRFYVSVPVIANSPTGDDGQLAGPLTGHGGLLVIDPTKLSRPTATIGAFDPATNTGLLMLNP